MGDCTITLNLKDGKTIFHSDQELDAALYKNRAALYLDHMKEPNTNKTFKEGSSDESLNLTDDDKKFIDSVKFDQKTPVSKILSLKNDTNDLTAKAKLNQNNDAKKIALLSVNSIVGIVNGGDMRFSEDTQDEASIVRKNNGTVFHALLSQKLGKAINQNDKAIIAKSKLLSNGGKILVDTMVNTIVGDLHKVHDSRNGEQKAIILTEVPISAMIGTALARILTEKAGNANFTNLASYGKLNDVNHVKGRIDILVIEPNGTVYIYDLKTKAEKSWNSVTHGTDISNSTADNFEIISYMEMLEQAGIPVKNPRFIPIVLETNEDESAKVVKYFNNKPIVKANVGNYKNTISNFFPKSLSKIKDIDMVEFDTTVSELITPEIPLTQKQIDEIIDKMTDRYMNDRITTELRGDKKVYIASYIDYQYPDYNKNDPPTFSDLDSAKAFMKAYAK